MQQLVILQKMLKKIHKRASRGIKKRRFKKYRFINGPVTVLAIPALLGEHVTGPYEG